MSNINAGKSFDLLFYKYNRNVVMGNGVKAHQFYSAQFYVFVES